MTVASLLSLLLFLQASPASPSMRPGGISLYQDRLPLGEKGRTLLLRIYVVPKGKLNSDGKAVGREDIRAGTSIRNSPFHLELFDESRHVKRPINSICFVEDGDVREVLVRWLRPQQKRGPVILMRFGVGDEGEWLIASYPRGPAFLPVLLTLSFGAGPDYGTRPHFDGVDQQGNLMLWEEYFEGNKRGVRRFHWNGRAFSGLSKGTFLREEQ